MQETGPVTDPTNARPVPDSPAGFPGDSDLPTDTVTWGPDIGDESALRMLGTPAGRKFLVLGLGRGHAAVALAAAGAKVIAIDPDLSAIDATRRLADAAEVKVEIHHGDLAEIPFLRADSIDAALSVYELGRIDDLDRVLRQVNRVLRTGGTFTASLPHPAWGMVEHNAFGPPRLIRTYGDSTAQAIDGVTLHLRSIGEVVASFQRANFRIDHVLEPMGRPERPDSYWSEVMALVPATLIVRGRKEGV